MSYSKTTWVDDTTALSAEKMNNIEDGIEAIDTCAGATITQPVRLLDTVYQNTTGVTIIVIISPNLAAGASATAYIGATSSPATLVGKDQNGSPYSAQETTMTFAVPPSYYYKVVSSGTVTCPYWSEVKVH